MKGNLTMINRKEVVQRHYPQLKEIDPLSPLAVGNGSFAFTADVTGLQSFPELYQVPLGTQSVWGWHYTGKPNLYTEQDIIFQQLHSHGRQVGYPLYEQGEEEAYHWLRQNPHRLQLGQLSFRFTKENGEQVLGEEIEAIDQQLNLWEGILYSRFLVEGKPVQVTTACHPTLDQLLVKVVSPLISAGQLQVQLRFPAPDMLSREWSETVDLHWQEPHRHRSLLLSKTAQAAQIKRVLDEDTYQLGWAWSAGDLQQTDTHQFTLYPEQGRDQLYFTILFEESASTLPEERIPVPPVEPVPVAPAKAAEPTTVEWTDLEEVTLEAEEDLPITEILFRQLVDNVQQHWQRFWQSGAAIDFSGSKDPRAHELERRVVLSQFLTALHCTGALPPQETGLLYNSWFGKFHLEMHWWHVAHFPLWDRSYLMEDGLDWYISILPLAKDLANSQGYEGARWPKMVGVDGKQSPSSIAPVLIWQQPHPIALAELCYQANPNSETLQRWREIVVQSAHFMASYAKWDEQQQAYVLGPPLIPAQECHQPEESSNPPYELEYWKYGLQIASRWLERLEEEVPAIWLEVAQHMADPPHAHGLYLAHANCPDTFTRYNHDHPSMVGALGMLPGSLINPTIMKQTLQKVRDEWQWDTAWGWDFPMCAMTAARLGEPSLALDFLLMDAPKNTYLANGHNYQRPGLSAYLPGNGALLMAVAMMACGWQGAAEQEAPGFPKDGSWSVQWEGLKPLL